LSPDHAVPYKRNDARPARLTLWWLAATLALSSAIGCAESPYVWVGNMPIAAEQPAPIGPRDTILVLVRNQPSLSGEFVVRDDGGYMHPTIGNVGAAGKQPDALAAELKVSLRPIVVDPEVTVAILKTASLRVDVIGEVKTPGPYELSRDRGVVGALAAAGWLTEFARRDRVFVVRRSPGGAPSEPAHRIRFRADELTVPGSNAARFRLRDGDLVVVE
jgi:polysaccharide export outer membrane protein